MEENTLELLDDDVDYEYDLREEEEEKYLNLEEVVDDTELGTTAMKEDHNEADHGESCYNAADDNQGDSDVGADAACEELSSSGQLTAVFEEEEEEEEEEETAHGRGRFRSERSNIISLTSREAKIRNIPDSLDVVAVPTESSRLTKFRSVALKNGFSQSKHPLPNFNVGVAPPMSRDLGPQRPQMHRREVWSHPQDNWPNGPPPTASIPPRKVLINPKYQGHVDVPSHGHALLLRNRAPANVWSANAGPRMSSRPFSLAPTRELGPCFHQSPPYSRPPPPIQGPLAPGGDGLLPLPLNVQESLLQTLVVLQQQQHQPQFTPHTYQQPPPFGMSGPGGPPQPSPQNPQFYGPSDPLRGTRQPPFEDKSLAPLMSCLVPRPPPPQRSFQPPAKLPKPDPAIRLPPPTAQLPHEFSPKRKVAMVGTVVTTSPFKTIEAAALRPVKEPGSLLQVSSSSGTVKHECPSPDSSETVTELNAKKIKVGKPEGGISPALSVEEAQYLRRVEEQKLLRQKLLQEKAQKRRLAALTKGGTSQMLPPVAPAPTVSPKTALLAPPSSTVLTSTTAIIPMGPVIPDQSNGPILNPAANGGARKKVKYKIRRWLNKDRQLIRMEKVLFEEDEAPSQASQSSNTAFNTPVTVASPVSMVRPVMGSLMTPQPQPRPVVSAASQERVVKLMVRPRAPHAVQPLVSVLSTFSNATTTPLVRASPAFNMLTSCWLRIGSLPAPLGQRLEIQIDPNNLEELLWVPGENVAVVEFSNPEAAVAFKERCERESLLGPSAQLCFVDI